MLGLADNAPFAAPAVTRAIAEVTEHPGGLARGQAQAPGLGTLFAERGLQAGIACQTEHIIDAMLLAPPHQRLVGEAAVTAQNDAHARPRLADLADDARHLFDRAIAAGNIRTPPPGQQQMPAAEHVERQVAGRVIITMEEPAFLSAVQRNVGIVEIEHDLARRTLMRLQEKLDQQRVNLWPVTIDPVILRGVAFGRVLETIERALARQCFTVRPQHRMQLAGQHAECWVFAQLVVVIEVLVAQHQAKDPLSHQCLNPVLNVTSIATVGEATGEPTDQSKATIHLPQQQRPRVRGDVAAVETSHHRSPFNRFKFEQRRATLCLHRGHPGFGKNCSRTTLF